MPPLLAHACQQLINACTVRRARNTTPLDRIYAALLLASIANIAAAALGSAADVTAVDIEAEDELEADLAIDDADDDWGLHDAPQLAIDDPFSLEFESLFATLPERGVVQ